MNSGGCLIIRRRETYPRYKPAAAAAVQKTLTLPPQLRQIEPGHELQHHTCGLAATQGNKLQCGDLVGCYIAVARLDPVLCVRAGRSVHAS